MRVTPAFDQTRTLLIAGLWPVAIAAAGVMLAGCTAAGRASSPRTTANPAATSASTSWRPPADPSAAAARAGLPMLSQKMLAVHYHAHLDVQIAGTPIVVPAGLGIDQARQRISPLHTHDTSG